MVFSQTSLKTQSILKVVDLDCLKSNKVQQQANSPTGVITGGNTQPSSTSLSTSPSLPTATSSFSEERDTSPLEFLKMEPAYDSAMFHDSDCEFFQDLVQWCSDPVKEEQLQTIDQNKVTEERAHNNNTLYTPISPQGWEVVTASSPVNAPTTPYDPLSPNTVDGFEHFSNWLGPGISNINKMQNQEDFLDFNNMPVVFDDVGSEKAADVSAVQVAGLVGWEYLHTDNNLHLSTNTLNTMPFVEEEESKFVSVIPRELESNDVVITEVIYGSNQDEAIPLKRQRLTVSIPGGVAGWPHQDLISTPDIVNCVEQMENETGNLLPPTTENYLLDEDSTGFISTDICQEMKHSPKLDYEPITPKSESIVETDEERSSKRTRKRRRQSDDSDDTTYTPYEEPTRRKYTRRKPDVPIKDMIKALEGSQPVKAKRGRPPKRRESTVSSVCSIDDNSSNVSTHENKYRELRDKNNEASKRSRMSRKLKDLQMEQLVIDLEERNKRLKVKADILEDMTKRLKDALMSAILQKQ